MDGKTLRLRRIVSPRDGKTVIVPLDHGMSNGPIRGLISPGAVLKQICSAHPDAVIIHKGLVRYLPRDLDSGIGLIIHLSASTSLSDSGTKTLVTGVDNALALGADCVSMHVNFSGAKESEMLGDLGKVSDRCMTVGMPLLVMAYLRGGTLAENDVSGLAIAASACAELGADLVKLPWPGSIEAMAHIVAGCPAGVIMAGGSPCQSSADWDVVLKAAMAAGAVGAAVGRNVFQSPDPNWVLRKTLQLVHSPDSLPQSLQLTMSVGS